LNESVPNVLIDKSAIDLAIRKVWQSPFSEKSIDWRNLALKKETVTVAEPSVVVMPTVQASSSGVILSKGTDEFVQGKGKISANWGIGSVVESGRPVEEITLEAGPIHQSLTVSDSKPVAKATGGLEKQETTPGLPVLNETQIKELNKAAIQVEKTLGEKPFGYDIEWAYDADGKLIILQARPNMP
jgi:phosphoenolpyruvate synthase/pyruvate phosphate dikinase